MTSSDSNILRCHSKDEQSQKKNTFEYRNTHECEFLNGE